MRKREEAIRLDEKGQQAAAECVAFEAAAIDRSLFGAQAQAVPIWQLVGRTGLIRE